MDRKLMEGSEAYVDGLMGPGAGKRHSAFLDRVEPPSLREALHRCHLVEGDEAQLGRVENYLIGMAVLCAVRSFGPAAMFAKTLRKLDVPPAKIMEVVGRLAMWIGPVPAADAAGHIQKAMREYDERGAASMDAWFPGGGGGP